VKRPVDHSAFREAIRKGQQWSSLGSFGECLQVVCFLAMVFAVIAAEKSWSVKTAGLLGAGAGLLVCLIPRIVK